MLPILAADALLPARYQMAVSLGWHIIIAAFAVVLLLLLAGLVILEQGWLGH